MTKRLLVMLVCACWGCEEPAPAPPVVEPPVVEPPVVEPPEHVVRIPSVAGAMGPARTELQGELAADIADVEQCAPCHEDVVRQWKTSAHAHASFDNPWYRAVIDGFRESRGNEASRFCAGCHDIALLVEGGMDTPIEPSDSRAHAGVTCLVCHSTIERRADGNGSYLLRVDPAPPPDPNSEAQVEAHRRRMAPAELRTSAQCGTCHRSFLGREMGNPHHLPGVEDIGSWRASAFNGNHAARVDDPDIDRTCQGCHMREEAAPRDFAAEDGVVSSHRVASSHTALHAQTDDIAAAQATAMLQGSASIDVAAARVNQRWSYPAEEADLHNGHTLALDVVVRNLEAGHRFPGGTRDLQDTWIEVEIEDARGVTIARAGTDHHRRDDPSALRLRAVLLDERGVPGELHFVHDFRALAFDRTIAPRDAMVARYVTTLPDDVPLPIRVRARLRHRRHGHAMHRFACAATRSTRGRAFARAARRLGKTPIDGCRTEPITDVAEHVTWIGGPAPEPQESRPAFDRHYDHALGLLHNVQERLDEARPLLNLALEIAPDDRRRAAVFVLLGRLTGRQGRQAEASRHLDRAENLLPEHPAIAHARGDAFAQVWRWQEAAAAYAIATARAPGDVGVWRDLARARGSAGDNEGVLEATSRGLLLGPRNPDLLRSQALALEALDDPRAPEAREAFLRHRRVDEQPQLLRRCQREVAGCDRDRQPVPEIEMH